MKKLLALIALIILSAATLMAQYDHQLDSLIHNYYQNNKPGIALAVIKDGQVIENREVGLANIEYNIPISDSTAFHIASISKQFTAYLALLLEQEGKLKMSDKISTYLPELKSLPYDITLYQLANHTHGLPNVSELANTKGFGTSDRMWHEDVVNMALRIRTFNFKPGERYQYNNTGFVLLAEIIQRVSKLSFQEALIKYICQPLEMPNTLAVPDPDLIIKNKAESYSPTSNGYKRFDANIMSNGSSGMKTTIQDLTKWALHFQKTAHDTNSPFVRMIQPSYLNNGAKVLYGLGMEMKNYKGLEVFFHGGGDAGHRAYTLHIPAHNFSVLILGNGKDFWPLTLSYQIVDLYLADHLKKPSAQSPSDTNYRALASFEGTYEIYPGTYYTFEAQNDSLYVGIVGTPLNIAIPRLDDTTFVFPFAPVSKFTFKDNSVAVSIADMIYPCPKADPILKQYKPAALEKFVGFYRNETLNTIYEIAIEDNQLIARHAINFDIPLQGLENNSFFSTLGYFGKIDFQFDKNSAVTAFKLSGQNMKGLVFEKISK